MNIKIAQILSLSALCMIAFSSCKLVKSKDYNALVNENVQMREDIFRSDSIQVCFMGAYAEIERNLDEIKAREKMINNNSIGAEGNTDRQQKIISDIVEIGKLMDKNRKQLRQMQSLRRELIKSRKQMARIQEENNQLKNGILPTEPKPAPVPATNTGNSEKLSYYQQENQRLSELNKQMEETINQLKNKVTESEARIESLQEELALLKDAYAALQVINDSLQVEIVRYQREVEEKDSEIETLNDMARQAFYFMGNSKTIKSKKILDKKSVSSSIKDADFIRLPNYDEKRVIETNSSKVNILSTHPSSSYTINKKDSKNLKIEIKNPDKFWSITRYCIIEIK